MNMVLFIYIFDLGSTYKLKALHTIFSLIMGIIGDNIELTTNMEIMGVHRKLIA